MLIWTGPWSGRNQLGCYLCNHGLVQETWKLVLGFIQGLQCFELPAEHLMLEKLCFCGRQKGIASVKIRNNEAFILWQLLIFFTLPFDYFAYMTVLSLPIVLTWHLFCLLGSTSVQWVAFYKIIFSHQFLSL